MVGDYLAVPFPPGNDLILMCNILHQERPASVRTLFRKAAEALTEEGWLIIHETLLDDQEPPPLPVALTALNNLLYYGGKSHHEYQILKWLKTSGFCVHQIQRAEQPGVRLITAQRASSSE